jgi:hypothetical protein
MSTDSFGGTGDYIPMPPGTRSTSIIKRKTPLIIRDDQKTLMAKTGIYDRDLMNRRRVNIENAINTKIVHEKDWLNPFKNENVMNATCALPGELAITWNHPKNAVWLNHTKEDGSIMDFDGDNHLSFNTTTEATMHSDELNRYFTLFNGMSMADFVKRFDSNTKSKVNDVFTWNTSEELMAAIKVVGINRDTMLLASEDLANQDDVKSSMPLVERVEATMYNTAHEGVLIKDGRLMMGKPQTFSKQDLIVWEFPYFDNHREGFEMLEKYEIKPAIKAKGIPALYSYRIHEDFLNRWTMLMPEEYRNDGRFTLPWKKYDPSQEFVTTELATHKHSILTVLFGIDKFLQGNAVEKGFDELKNIVDGPQQLKLLNIKEEDLKFNIKKSETLPWNAIILFLFLAIRSDKDARIHFRFMDNNIKQQILYLKQILPEESWKLFQKDPNGGLWKLHTQNTIESRVLSVQSESRKFAKCFKGSVNDSKSIEWFVDWNTI